MAKGGRAGRTYVRDGRGRFASTPGGGSRKPIGGLPKRQPRKAGTPPPQRRGLVTQRAAVRRSSAKLKAKDPADRSYSGTLSRRAQKAAVTRAGNKLAAAMSSGRRRITPGAQAGIVRPGRKGKGKAAPAKPDATLQAPKVTRAPRGQGKPRNKTGRKVDVQIRRAGTGGEYGPDGHFYAAGAWMPAGKFQGGKQQGTGNGAANGKDGKSKDGGRQVTTIRQRQPEPPIVRPTGKAIDAPQGISARGQQNRDTLFGDTGYVSVKKSRRTGQTEIVIPGYMTKGGSLGPLQTAAIASRMTMKQMGQAILRLRGLSKDKRRFDDYMNYDFNSYSDKRTAQQRRREQEAGMVDYADMRRRGLLPRNSRVQLWRRANQFTDAVRTIAAERSSRPGNRRDFVEEFAWVMNNVIGSRAPRKPTRKPITAPSANGAPRRAMLTGMGTGVAFRPISTRRLIAAGGSRWQKNEMDRVYFNAVSQAKVFFDRNTRKMGVKASSAEATAAAQAEARKIERQGRRPIAQRWSKPKRKRRSA